MASFGDTTDPSAPPETEDQRSARVAREAELIAAARARLDAGQGIGGAELQAWFDADAATDEPIPVPDAPGAVPRVA